MTTNNANRWQGVEAECPDCGEKFVKTATRSHCHRCRHYRERYGITSQQVNALWIGQRGECAICGVGMTRGTGSRGMTGMVVDHNGPVRGLLCQLCNKGLGQFKDDVNRLRSAIAYLEAGQ